MDLKNRGFFGIGIWGPKHECNVGGLFRSADAFGASFLFTVGRKYQRRAADTTNATHHIPNYNYLTGDDLVNSTPIGCQIVCVELADNARELSTFCHPDCAIYVLGNESMGIPTKFMQNKIVVQIPTRNCLNVASAGTVVMYDRIMKQRTRV